MATFTLTADEQVPVTVVMTDAYGNAVGAPSGVPTWSIDNGAVATATADATGLTGEFVTVGPVGTVNFTVTLGALTTTDQVTVTPGAEKNLAIVFGTPVAKPAA